MRREVMELARDAFGSVWALELLIILHRNPARAWLSQELINELRSSSVIVGESVARLGSSGLVSVAPDGAVSYAPANENLGAIVHMLIEEYRARPAAVRRLIVQGSDDKLRSFANAFRLKSE
jgi:hypothetical protein